MTGLKQPAAARRRGSTEGAALLVLAVLVVGVLASLYFYREARRARQVALVARQQEEAARAAADEQQLRAAALTGFMEETLAASDPPAAPADINPLLERASQDAHRHFIDEPLVEVRLRITLGRTYTKLGEFERGARELARACARAAEVAPNGPLAAEAAAALAELQRQWHAADPDREPAAPVVEPAEGAEGPVTTEP